MTEYIEIVKSIKYKTNIKLSQMLPLCAEWLKVCNAVSKISFDNGNISNNIRLHKLCYSEMREKYDLSSQMTCNAIRYVASKYATIKSNKQKIDKPVFFKKNIVQMQNKYDFRYCKDGLSIQSLTGRIKSVEIQSYKHADQYSDWKKGGCLIQVTKNDVYIIQSYSKNIEKSDQMGSVIGVDRGINYLAVATDGKKQLFFSGKRIKHKKRKYQKVKSALQKKKAENKANGKNTKSIQKVLNRLSGRERRFVKDVNHCVSKKIVEFAVNQNAGIISLEDLSGIRKSANRKGKSLRKDVNQWSFYELQQFIEYKANEKGISIDLVNPEYTSQACSNCGYTHENNRNKHKFKCLSCNYELHSDLNASRNIKMRSVLVRQDLYEDGLQVNQPEVGLGLQAPSFMAG